jgi:predicted RNA-binding protein YlxR (DUF448 family)
VEPDPHRRRGGRGAYLCPQESCLSQAVRRARWAHAFRAPAALSPEGAARVRAWIEARGAAAPAPLSRDGQPHPAAAGGLGGPDAEGGW